MKKFFILASAAIVALASCSKTQVVYNDAPEEIGFKNITNVMTKALGDQLHDEMGVFANYTPAYSGYDLPDGVIAYASYGTPNQKFVDNTTYWGASPKAMYWPLVGKLDFAVYAPYSASGVQRDYTESVNKLAVSVSNGTLASQVDWLYGTTVVAQQSKTNNAMPVTLRHALAKITITVTSDLAGLVINSLDVDDTEQVETFTVNYAGTDADLTDGDSRISWTNTGDPVDLNLVASDVTLEKDVAKTYTCYVIPSDQTSITMSYTLPGGGSELPYKHTFTSAKWVDNTHYTYNIKIGVNEIKFEPSETGWDTETALEIAVDPNTPNN